MDLSAYGHALAALTYSALAAVLARDAAFRKTTAAALFLGGVACTAAWGWTALATSLPTPPAWLPWLAADLDLARYALWFACLLRLLRPSGGAAPPSRSPSILAGFAWTLVALQLVTSSLPALGIAIDLVTRAALVAALALPVLGVVLVEQLYRNATEDSRWGVKPLCLGLGTLFVFDIYFFSHAALFTQFDSDAVSARGLVVALGMPLLFVAARRQSGRAGELRLSRSAAFHTASLLLVGLYLLFIASIGYYVRRFGGDWGSALQLALAFLALAVLVAVAASATMRAKLRVFLGKNFFSYRYDYRAEWLRFTATLSQPSAPQDVGTAVIRGLADLVESPGGALWSRALNDDEFVQLNRWNMAASAGKESAASDFSRLLESRDWIVDLDESRSAPEGRDGFVPPAWLADLPGAWLVVPLRVGERLAGFVVLARARTALTVDWEVRDLLKTAGRQAAVFLAQMHATEALLEARKFDSFHRMSAFVVHDLKNIVTQLSLMLKNARRLHANPEFQQDMMATIENSLAKMQQLMLQLREGKAPAGSIGGVDLGPVARRIAEAASQRGRRIELRLGEGVIARGEEQRIERVLGHVTQNALDATPAEGRVWLEIVRHAGQVRAVIGDTGQGMSADFVRNCLFKPFSTTKEGGMGIGAYESFQYLKELGGSIAVDSEVTRGTIVTVLLPLLETHTRSDLAAVAGK